MPSPRADDERECKSPKLRRLLLAILLNGPMLVSAIESSVMSPFFPLEAKAKGLSTTQVGVVSSIMDVSFCATSLAAGPLIPRIGLRTCLSLGCLALAAGASAFAAVLLIADSATFFIVCIILRTLIGAAGAITETASFAFVMERATGEAPFLLVSDGECCPNASNKTHSQSWNPLTQSGC